VQANKKRPFETTDVAIKLNSETHNTWEKSKALDALVRYDEALEML
jgi:hypothetical protein